ncbi:hypothetical protein BJY00DRAFT_171574 [Aspergillus carlsbadensis]|nr:hypothetical protein BJY00DRAFT_171574 [Aspergillus carlsbadensis]
MQRPTGLGGILQLNDGRHKRRGDNLTWIVHLITTAAELSRWATAAPNCCLFSDQRMSRPPSVAYPSSVTSHRGEPEDYYSPSSSGQRRSATPCAPVRAVIVRVTVERFAVALRLPTLQVPCDLAFFQRVLARRTSCCRLALRVSQSALDLSGTETVAKLRSRSEKTQVGDKTVGTDNAVSRVGEIGGCASSQRSRSGLYLYHM